MTGKSVRAHSRLAFRWFAILVLVLTASSVRAQPRGSYLDTDGTVKDVDEEYERLHRIPTSPHYVRSFVEMGIGLGLFTVGYWSLPHAHMEDWDDPKFWDRLSGAAWRTDNNSLAMNFLLHPIAGAYVHAGARGNHHSVLEAMGYGLLTSFLWEFVFEFREFVSVNDLIVTTTTGTSLGEFMHKLGLYLDTSRRPNAGVKALQWTFGTGVQMDRLLDGRDAPEPPARDTLGMTSDIAHDFWLHAVAHSVRTRGGRDFGVYRLGFEGSLVSIPGYRRPGHFGKFFYHADVTSAKVRLEASEHGPGGFLASDTILIGYHTQAILGTKRAARGVAATMGASTAYRYLDSTASGIREQLSAAHLIGPALDWHATAPNLRVDLNARAYLDYAGVQSHAYPQWEAAYPDETGKHIIRNRGYFYAWGASGVLEAKVDAGPLRLQGSTFYGRYWSQDGINRWQERVTVDVPARTTFVQLNAGLQLRLPSTPIAIGASAEVRRWVSSAAEFNARRHVISRGIDASMRF